MNDIENKFFEKYKELDSLCKDVLNSNQGVTQYICEMEKTSGRGRYYVHSWDYDYKMLKHVRWVRNNIAHSNGGSECSENDIKYVKDFYQRIMQQKDPFSIIYQRQNEIKKRTVKQSEIKPNPYINNRKTTNKNRGYTRLTVGIFIVIIVVLLMIMSRLLGNLWDRKWKYGISI